MAAKKKTVRKTKSKTAKKAAVRKQSTAVSTVVVPENKEGMLAVIQQAAHSKDVDVEKMRALLDMQKEIFEKNAEVAFIKAMTAVQQDLKPVLKKEDNKQTKSKYAKAQTIDKMLTPIYTRHGFSLSFNTGESQWKNEGYIRILCYVSHSEGHTREYSYDLPPDVVGIQGNPNKTKVHGHASSVTYGQRYLKTLIFNITFIDDNDGNGPGEDDPDDAGYVCITEQQEMNIKALMEEVLPAKKRQGDYMRYLGVSKLADIPATQYEKAISLLENARE